MALLSKASATARLLRLRVRIPPRARMFVSCECCVLSGRGLCDELITRTEAVLLTVARRCGWPRNLKNKKAIARVGAQRHRKPLIVTWQRQHSHSASQENFDIHLTTAAQPAFESLCISDTLQITKQVKAHIPVTTQEMLTSCHIHQS